MRQVMRDIMDALDAIGVNFDCNYWLPHYVANGWFATLRGQRQNINLGAVFLSRFGSKNMMFKWTYCQLDD